MNNFFLAKFFSNFCQFSSFMQCQNQIYSLPIPFCDLIREMCTFPRLCSARIKSIHVLHMLFALRVIVYNLAQTLIHHVDPMGLKVSLRDYHLFSTWHIPDITEIYIHKKVQFGYHISLEKVMVSDLFEIFSFYFEFFSVQMSQRQVQKLRSFENMKSKKTETQF